MERFDVIIIGGAIMGSATAYFLSANPHFKGRVLVVEKDSGYSKAASALSVSGVRQQFSSPVNVKLSQFFSEFIRTSDFDLSVDGDRLPVPFHENGYMYLAGEDQADLFQRNFNFYRELGVAVDLLDKSTLRSQFQWLNLDEVEVGIIGRRGEGWTDGYLLMTAFRRKARANGVEFRSGEVVGLEWDGEAIRSVSLSDGSSILADHIVNSAGAQGPTVARMAGIELPVVNRKQVIFNFESPVQGADMPFTFCPERLFFRPEGNSFLAGLGIEIRNEDEARDFDVPYQMFEEVVWPKLASRVSGFERARLKGGWAGHYDVSLPDKNAFIGKVPGLARFYLCNGFSGHGVMHSPGVGRALSELITYGEYRSIDLSDLAIGRLGRGRQQMERIQY
jgi:glycine/D-amino acid oxidase-like deaminating enzyme